jgi:hypothetical protein
MKFQEMRICQNWWKIAGKPLHLGVKKWQIHCGNPPCEWCTHDPGDTGRDTTCPSLLHQQAEGLQPAASCISLYYKYKHSFVSTAWQDNLALLGQLQLETMVLAVADTATCLENHWSVAGRSSCVTKQLTCMSSSSGQRVKHNKTIQYNSNIQKWESTSH